VSRGFGIGECGALDDGTAGGGLQELSAVWAEASFWEITAPLIFLGCWMSYWLFADLWRPAGRSLMQRVDEFRRAWLLQMLVRDNRMVDVQVVQTLVQNVSFFASSAILIVGGFVAVLGASEQARAIAAEIPFAERSSPLIWDLKILLLIVIFVYAFFKFTWSLRQFNYVAILIGAAPYGHTPESIRLAAQIALVAGRASDHFNRAMRAYYFGLAALSWFIQSWLFAFCSVLVIVIVYRREYRSAVLAVLGPVGQPIPGMPAAAADER
jgi:uncharacterized membrane protein